MKSIARKIALPVLACVLLSACATHEPPVPPTAFRLSSPGMPDNAMLARKHAGNLKSNPNCLGDNVSPALEWSNVPDKARSLVMLMDDQAGRGGLGVSHMIVYGIPTSVTSFAEGELSAPPTQARFVAGKSLPGPTGYFGPVPAARQRPAALRGDAHRHRRRSRRAAARAHEGRRPQGFAGRAARCARRAWCSATRTEPAGWAAPERNPAGGRGQGMTAKFKGRREDDRLLTGQGRYTARLEPAGAALRRISCAPIARTPRSSRSTSRRRAPHRASEPSSPARTCAKPTSRPRRRSCGIRAGRHEAHASRIATCSRTDACATSARKWRWSSRTRPAPAQDAAEAIEVEYRDLPAIVEVRRRARARRAAASRGHSRQRRFDYEYGDEAARPKAAFAAAAHVTRVTLESEAPRRQPDGAEGLPRRLRRGERRRSTSIRATQGMSLMLGGLARDHRPCRPRRSASTRTTSAAASASARTPTPSTAR